MIIIQGWLGDLGSWAFSAHGLLEVAIILMMMVITMTIFNGNDDNDDDLLQMPGTGGGGEHGQREHFLIRQGHLLRSRGD